MQLKFYNFIIYYNTSKTLTAATTEFSVHTGHYGFMIPGRAVIVRYNKQMPAFMRKVVIFVRFGENSLVVEGRREIKKHLQII